VDDVNAQKRPRGCHSRSKAEKGTPSEWSTRLRRRTVLHAASDTTKDLNLPETDQKKHNKKERDADASLKPERLVDKGKGRNASRAREDTSRSSKPALYVETERSTNPESTYVFDNVTLTISPKKKRMTKAAGVSKEPSLPGPVAFRHPHSDQGPSFRGSDVPQESESDTIRMIVVWMNEMTILCKNDQSALHPEVAHIMRLDQIINRRSLMVSQMVQGMRVVQRLQEKHPREIDDRRSELGNDVSSPFS
jgi:hypothetical protein